LPNANGGGAERVIINIIKYLPKTKYSIFLILLSRSGKYVDILPNNIDIIDLSSSRARYSLIKLYRVINKIKPNIVLTTLMHVNILLLVISFFSFKRKYKIIVREANYISKQFELLGMFKKRIYTRLVKFSYPRADFIIAQCNEMRFDLIDRFHLNAEKIKVIYNPIDIDYIERMANINLNPFKNGKVNVLAVGRLTYQKGFDLLIQALSIVKEVIPNVHLTILGEGEDLKMLEDLVKYYELDSRVSFKGFVSNPYVYYKNCDIYVLSSKFEGFPNTLLEALACGCKVVSTDCKSGPREILGNNEYGTLVKVNDVKSLADGIVEAYNGQNKAGKRYEYFDVTRIVKQYEELFDK